MNSTGLKQRLYTLIEEGDEKLLSLLVEVASEYKKDDLILPGKPMTSDELVGRIKSARSRIDSGDFISMKDLEEEMKNW